MRITDKAAGKTRVAGALIGAAVVLTLAACGGGRDVPDAFVVVEKRPLIVPPDFQLRPPEPGKPSPIDIRPTEEVLDALFPDRDKRVPLSAGEQALLKRIEEGAGAPVRADARAAVGSLETDVVRKGPMVAELLALPPRSLASDGSTIERVRSEPRTPR
ncbi:MAG: hypothetical protein KatS3mg119_1596 [Rhodothalassiaceae bacterium]|nr:MAG: hypothetical protein KatS3mg119_1596 [Rhodothalassiaceae bacterium]